MYKKFTGKIWGGYCWERLTEERIKDIRALENYGFKVFSQNDEDGIIEEIFNRIGTTNKEFIEFGVQNGLESNGHYLLHKGWKGLWIDGNEEYCKEIAIRFRPMMKFGNLKVKNAFIDADNINSLISKNFFGSKQPDLLSIDIDGNDWYVWDAISVVEARVVVVEYNAKFPPNYNWKQAYNKSHVWDGISDWHGASLKALEEVGNKKGYKLVGTNMNGCNAFFVLSNLVDDKFLENNTAEHMYNPMRKDLTFCEPGHISRWCLAGQENGKGYMNYFGSKSEFEAFIEKERKENSIIRKVKKRLSGNGLFRDKVK